MKSAVIINLDYERHDAASCRRVWNEIDCRMQEAGFSKHKRLFISSLDRESAGREAKAIVAGIENDLATEGIVVFDIIGEFYCFEYEQMNDLLDPSHHTPEVSFLDTGTFRAFLAKED